MAININKINSKFEKAGKSVIKFRNLNILLFIILAVFSWSNLKNLKPSYSNDSWYMDDDPVIRLEERFDSIFGNNSVCAVLAESEDIFTKQNLENIRELGFEIKEKVPFADEVISVSDMEFIEGEDESIIIDQLVPDPVPSDKASLEKIREKALFKKSVKNRIISEDSTESWIILRLGEYPENHENNQDYINYIKAEAEKYPELYKGIKTDKAMDPENLAGVIFKRIVNSKNYPSLKLTPAGLPVLVSDKRDYFMKESPRLVLTGILASVIILIIALRSFRGVIFPVISSILSMIITFGIEGFFRTEFDPSLISVPLFLGLAVSIGYSVHIFTFYRQELVISLCRKKAAVKAVRDAGWPLLFTALTTIAALLSFQFINVQTLRWIGNTSALMVASTYFMSVILFSSLLSYGKVKPGFSAKSSSFTEFLSRKLPLTDKIVSGSPKKIILIYIIITVIAVSGFFMVEVSFDISKTMGDKVEYVKRNLHVGNSDTGSIYSYDIGIEFREADAVKDPENLKKLEKLVTAVESYRLTKKTSSILDVLKDVNQVLNEDNEEFYRLPETRNMAAQLLLLYENAGGTEAEKWFDYDYQRYHIKVDLNYYNSKEAVREFAQIRDMGRALFPDADLFLYGNMIKFTEMQQRISWGQIKAFLIAMAVISLLMMLVFGSITTGLIGMIPNISPALIIGGIMGFFDIPLDMMTCTIIPMLMGLAVDDTIHFINHVQLGRQIHGDTQKSIKETFRKAGPALLMTSVILIINFSVYITSSAKLYQHFGILISAGIISALLSDFFVTPVLLKMNYRRKDIETAGIKKAESLS